MKISELVTNDNGRLSTTATVQAAGFVVLAGTLLFSVYQGNADTPTLYLYFAGYCGGLTASKGAVSAYKHKHRQKTKGEKPA